MSTWIARFSDVAESQPLGVKQLLEIVQPLGVEIEQLEGDAHRVAGIQLAQVAHMHLGGEARMRAAP